MSETQTARTIRLIREQERTQVLADLRAEVEALPPAEVDSRYRPSSVVWRSDVLDLISRQETK